MPVVFLLVLFVAAFAGVAVAVTTAARFAWMRRAFEWIWKSTGYFGYGVAGLVPIGVAGGIVYGVSRLDGDTAGMVGAWVFGAAAAYALLAGYGVLVKRFLGRWRALWASTEPSGGEDVD